ncbi:MAG: hypothetical protein ACRDXC_06170, partial [Acidimicrobiales bacterium]
MPRIGRAVTWTSSPSAGDWGDATSGTGRAPIGPAGRTQLTELHPFERDGCDGRDQEAPAVFRDRTDAGCRLAAMVSVPAEDSPVVVGLPRGGVPVAAEVAGALHAPLDVILVRKLGVPSQPELAVGAIGEGGVRVVHEGVRRAAAVSAPSLTSIEAHERAVLDHMARTFRRGRPPTP